jgi:long-chain acyl-CoA synthetase
MARSESYRYATRLAEEAVKALRAGRVLNLDAAATTEEQRRALGSSGGQDA